MAQDQELREEQQKQKKEIYRINLDHKRIVTLAGIFLLLMGFSFWLGSAFHSGERQISLDDSATPTFMLDEMQDPNELRMQANEELGYLERNLSKEQEIPVRNDPIQNNTQNFANNSSANNSYQTQRSGHYTVQVGAYNHEKDAKRVANELKSKGVHQARVDRGVLYYFVRAGKATRENSLVSLHQKIDKLLNVKSKIIFHNS